MDVMLRPPGPDQIVVSDGDAPMRPGIRFDGVLMQAVMGPLDIHRAQQALVRQQALNAPVKLAVSTGGTASLIAEVPSGGDGPWCKEQVGRALREGWAWFEEARNGSPEAAPAADLPSDVEKILAELECTWTVDGAGTYRVHGLDIPSVLLIECLAGETVRVSYPATAIRVATAGACSAMAYFALEANARLRFARVSVAPAGGADDVVNVGWDAMLFAGRFADRWLAEAVAAVSVAHAETARAMRALATDAVASAYLQARDPRCRINGSAQTRRANGKTQWERSDNPPARPPAEQ